MDKALLEKIGEVVPEERLRALLNEWAPIVHVDRTIRPAYPDFMKKVKCLEFELAGPADFDVRNLNPWLHPKQKKGVATGNEIFKKLIAKKLLDGCLNLADILAIQKEGGGFYRRYFLGLTIPAWKSVILHHLDYFCVPFLYEDGGEVELDWDCLDHDFCSVDPALHFAN